MYIIETEKDTPTAKAQSSSFADYRSSATNTAISALANVTNGGSTGVLNADLAVLKSAISNHSYQAMLQIDAAPANTAPYQDGFWLSRGTDGVGVSSAVAEFAFSSNSASGSIQQAYTVNVTSEVQMSGVYFDVEGESKDVNLTVNVLNEGKPALAQNFTVYFEYDGSLNQEDWVLVPSPSTIDFGNGTYRFSFNVEQHNHNDPFLILLQCTDKRGILVSAIVTCSSV
jgi:hypothetical protein